MQLLQHRLARLKALPAGCVVSVLRRSARVDHTGSWYQQEGGRDTKPYFSTYGNYLEINFFMYMKNLTFSKQENVDFA